jgi:UrcA family protein
MIKQFIATAALVTFATAAANATPTRTYDIRDVDVSYSASDLLSENRVAEIRADIVTAAVAACPVDIVQTARSLVETRECRAEAIAAANADLDARIARISQLASR